VPACRAGSGALLHDQKTVFKWALGWSRAGGDAVARGGAAHTALAAAGLRLHAEVFQAPREEAAGGPGSRRGSGGGSWRGAGRAEDKDGLPILDSFPEESAAGGTIESLAKNCLGAVGQKPPWSRLRLSRRDRAEPPTSSARRIDGSWGRAGLAERLIALLERKLEGLPGGADCLRAVVLPPSQPFPLRAPLL
jgi:hypothetical protein